MNKKQRAWRNRIIVALAIFAVMYAIDASGVLERLFTAPTDVYAAFVLFLIPYLIAGYDVLIEAAGKIAHGAGLDESLLMSIATIGAFAMVLFPESEPHMAEGAAVMLFYQVGELFQSYAVGRSRKSITDLMDIAPDYANIEQNGELVQVDPDDITPHTIIVVKPGERIPIDGVVEEGSSQVDTAALTGESAPRYVEVGSEVISGCVNMTGVLRVRTTKHFGESTVSRILELVENASERKARTENLITRLARVYTPAVTLAACLVAVLPPILGFGSWGTWVLRGLTFLVVSCPCALVISVPLSFFGGIGGASRLGVLVKGSNYLELLAHVDTVVFDKTGTLTTGTFDVVAVHPEEGISSEQVLEYAAHAEAYSNHPIALSVRNAYGQAIDQTRIHESQEHSGHGVYTQVDDHTVLVGNSAFMREQGSTYKDCNTAGTILHVACDGSYMGHIIIADVIKEDAQQAIVRLHEVGVSRCVMLTGDRADVAHAVADTIGLDEVYAELLPEDKVDQVERLLSNKAKGSFLAFVGDGINDAPVLTRADVGIAMGAMGSDAAIEAADIVLMDDKPSQVGVAIRLARKTMRIAWQNIVFALGVKIIILILAALGIANMWLAVFGDVGVAILAILNAMRAMRL